jgi:hypothetical protein
MHIKQEVELGVFNSREVREQLQSICVLSWLPREKKKSPANASSKYLPCLLAYFSEAGVV